MSENKIESVTIDLGAAPVASAEGELPRAPRVPYGVYKMRILDEPEATLSKKTEKPMLVFETEIIEPAAVRIEGVDYKVAGQKFTLYALLSPGDTQTIRNVHDQVKLPRQINIDPESGKPVGVSYKGLEIFVTASSETIEQEAGEGDAKQKLINPFTGKPLTMERGNIKSVLPVQ